MARVRALALIGTLCVVAWPAAAQLGDDDTSTSRANSRNAPTEEVTVRGRRSLAAYRRDVEAAHDRVLAIFNEINSNDEFDIHCRYESRTGTRMPARVCRPRFAGNVSSTAAKEYMAGLLSVCPTGVTQGCIFSDLAQGAISRAQGAESEAPYKHSLLVEEMRRLAYEDPRLMEAMLEHEARQLEYLEARERRRE